jgi:hypothetical protein
LPYDLRFADRSKPPLRHFRVSLREVVKCCALLAMACILQHHATTFGLLALGLGGHGA